MAMSLRSLLRGVSTSALRNHSTVVKVAQVADAPIQTFRTNEDNPINHNSTHLNRFYLMPPAVTKVLFSYGGLPKRFQQQTKTFTENAILIREPAIDIISYLQLSDYSRPINKYVLYGKCGSGKSITLAHLLHYALASQKLIIHIPWVPDWFRRPKEVAPSRTNEGLYDLPIDAAAWLVHFKHQNNSLLSKLNLKLSKDYTWNTRENNLAGSPLLELIDFGIARAKYTCEIIDALVNEIKMASTTGQCNTLVVIDGFNAFYGDDTNIRDKQFQYVGADKITITESFLKLVKSDWCNGAAVLTVDEIAVHPKKPHQSYFPRYLLGKNGFDDLDPFLPVGVSDYTTDEFETVMEYYKDRKWVRNINDEGQRELELLSNRNPYKLMAYTAAL